MFPSERHASDANSTLSFSFSKGIEASRRLDAARRPTCLPLIVQRGSELIDERDVGSTRRFVAVSLKKKKKDCYSNEVSVGIFFFFFLFLFFLAELSETMAKTRRKTRFVQNAVRAFLAIKRQKVRWMEKWKRNKLCAYG